MRERQSVTLNPNPGAVQIRGGAAPVPGLLDLFGQPRHRSEPYTVYRIYSPSRILSIVYTVRAVYCLSYIRSEPYTVYYIYGVYHIYIYGVYVPYMRRCGGVARVPGLLNIPPKVLRGGISKSILQRPCQFLAINSRKMAPRTSKGLQERAWDAPT